MKTTGLLILLSSIACSNANIVRGAENDGVAGRRLMDEFNKCMEDISEETVWPIPKSDPVATGRIDSAFGPVHSLCIDDDIFHKGIAVYGDPDDPVDAPYEGVVAMANADCVVIEHKFVDGDTCSFHGVPVKSWFTVFMGMKDIQVGHGDSLKTGDQIGKVGTHACKDGRFPRDTVEYRVMIGSYRSLAKAMEEGFVEQLYEPTINPLFAHPDLEQDHIVADAQLYGNGDVLITVTTKDDEPNVNRYEIKCDEGAKGDGAFHVLDLSLRIGFNAKDITAPLDKNKPYLDAQPFGNFRTHWTGHLIIPQGWMDSEKDKCEVKIYDIWDKEEKVDFEYPLDN